MGDREQSDFQIAEEEAGELHRVQCDSGGFIP